MLNADILQGVGRSGDDTDDSAREGGRSAARVVDADSDREAVDPALTLLRVTPNEDGGRLVVPRPLDIRLDGRCSFSSLPLY